MQPNKKYTYFPPEAEVRGSNPLGRANLVSPPCFPRFAHLADKMFAVIFLHSPLLLFSSKQAEAH